MAPERLLTENFLGFARGARISLLAVDEAHCVSQWGQDFRPSYLEIPRFLEALPTRPVLGAFTATATGEVKADIIKLLGLREPFTLTTGFDRPNLYFSVAHPSDKLEKLKADLAGRGGQSGIVYCATRKTVEEVCASLRAAGFAATRYHAGLTDEERRANQEDFAYDRATVMVATNAFGMGIDKSNVSFVAHYNMPKSMEAYYQEAGRAGRDGAPADCLLLYSKQDVRIARYLIENSDRENVPEALREELLRRDLQRMQDMVDYCTFKGCLRCRILRYFGEDAPARCGRCGNCDEAIRQAVRAAETGSAGQKERKRSKAPGNSRKGKNRQTLFETLRALRAALAKEEKVPPYVVFSNATLWDMADRRPKTIPQFLQVSGVGTTKAARYGKAFLAEIRRWEENET